MLPLPIDLLKLNKMGSHRTENPVKKKRHSSPREERLLTSHLFLSSSSLAGLLVLAPARRLPGFIGPVPPPLSIRVFFFKNFKYT
jgi:hypothetical protein